MENLTNAYVPQPFPQSALLLHTLSINAVVIALRRSMAFNFVSGLSGIRLGLLVWMIGTDPGSIVAYDEIRRVLQQLFVSGIIP